ncbi:polysaccharide deacetylase family protein [Streptomyces sp. NPDC101181]|uniref:polysaccharide deacetylase family protein n=1 Tax=Streptomyces sp. NPDC101181 TaxID=3366125 RepID=UPI0037F4E934
MDEVSVPTAVASSAQSSELLGYPPEVRLLIVNCDDFGMYPAINAAVIESIEEGIATSCSLMVPCPGAPQAMKLLSQRPQIPFGIHLTLVCEMPGIPWGPLSDGERVLSLLDPAGELFSPTPAGRATLLSQAHLDEIELEFRAQIDAVADAELTPTHLDFHCLADGGRDDILDLTVDLAAESGLAVRIWLEPGRQAMRSRRLPVTDNDFLGSYSLDLEGKAARYAQLLRDLPAGLNEWAVHPSLGDKESQTVDGGWLVRRTDYEFLISPQAREVLQQEDITVVDYRTIQRVWSKTVSP